MFRLARSIVKSFIIKSPIKLTILFASILMLGLLPSRPASAASVLVSNVTVNESAGTATFIISLPSGSRDISISYQTIFNSAVSPDDYSYETSDGYFTLSSTKPRSVVVQIIDDPLQEPTEKFILRVTESCGECNLPPVVDGIGTINDNDTPVTTPTPVPTPTPTPTPPTPTPVPTPTPTPTPPPVTPPPTTPPPVEVTPPASDSSFPSVTFNLPTNVNDDLKRSAFVKSVPDPTQLKLTLGTFIESALLTLLLILLILFPAEMFNSTLASNYNEVSGWFKMPRLRRFVNFLKRLPSVVALIAFAAVGAVINSQLSPDFGFNPASLALLLGIFITLVITSVVYDLFRALYLKRRFGLRSKLRTHVIGLMIGAILVLASRLANFVPGYIYGIFTALTFAGKDPSDKQDGEGLAVATIGLVALAALGWFAWIPVKAAATQAGADFPVLVLDATLSSLWVTALIAVVFGLAPIRFFYGEQVKKWNKTGWTIIYAIGVGLFAFTLLQGGIYGTSNKTSLISVLTLFIGFGAFSLLFWGYFRYRHLWRHTPDEPYEEH